MSEEDAGTILTQLAGSIQPSPYGPNRIGVNSGLHITGGEPFLNFELLLRVTRIAHRLGIPSTFVETNCFWCTDDDTTTEMLMELKQAGLQGILISLNPFILEQVPFGRTERAIWAGQEVFGSNAIVYQGLYYDVFKLLGLEGTLSFDEYFARAAESLRHVELIPMGRAPYRLGHLYTTYPAHRFFGERCVDELTRDWHVHIDNYGNYMPGFCGGISLGDARDMAFLFRGTDETERPLLQALLINIGLLYRIATESFGYEERPEGYVSKCHLCVDVRRHLVRQTDEFPELRPKALYDYLE
jgi:hypothetical protein